MTDAVRGYGGGSSCFEASLERLDEATDDLGQAERKLQRELGLAIVGTVKVAALCVGSPARLQSASCIIAAVQHVQTLFELQALAEDYERDVEKYNEALAEHLACLPR